MRLISIIALHRLLSLSVQPPRLLWTAAPTWRLRDSKVKMRRFHPPVKTPIPPQFSTHCAVRCLDRLIRSHEFREQEACHRVTVNICSEGNVGDVHLLCFTDSGGVTQRRVVTTQPVMSTPLSRGSRGRGEGRMLISRRGNDMKRLSQFGWNRVAVRLNRSAETCARQKSIFLLCSKTLISPSWR